MIKAFLFDADGVVIKKTKEYFSVKFAREYGAPIEELTNFFRTTYKLCQDGKLDLKQEIEPLLPKWGWDKGFDAFVDYWFKDDVVVDQEVMKVVADYRSKGVKCYIATDQDKYRGGYIRETLGLGKELDGCFFSFELESNKSETEFFKKILEKLNLPAAEVAYRDDDEKNVEVAKQLGIDAQFYKNIDDLTLEQDPPKLPRV